MAWMPTDYKCFERYDSVNQVLFVIVRIYCTRSSGPEQAVEEAKPRSAPVFVSKPEPVTVEEGEWARFCCRVTGHPKPRVMWLINGNTIVTVSLFYYFNMYASC